MKHKFIAIITLIILATAQKVIAQEPIVLWEEMTSIKNVKGVMQINDGMAFAYYSNSDFSFSHPKNGNKKLNLNNNNISFAYYDGNGNKLILVAETEIIVWDLLQNKQSTKYSLSLKPFRCFYNEKSNQLVAVNSQSDKILIGVTNIATGNQTNFKIKEKFSQFEYYQFSNDGQFLAIGKSESTSDNFHFLIDLKNKKGEIRKSIQNEIIANGFNHYLIQAKPWNKEFIQNFTPYKPYCKNELNLKQGNHTVFLEVSPKTLFIKHKECGSLAASYPRYFEADYTGAYKNDKEREILGVFMTDKTNNRVIYIITAHKNIPQNYPITIYRTIDLDNSLPLALNADYTGGTTLTYYTPEKHEIIPQINTNLATKDNSYKETKITDPQTGNVWNGKRNVSGKWNGTVKVEMKAGGMITLNYKKGELVQPVLFSNDEFSVKGNMDEQFRFHDTIAKYIPKNITDGSVYIVEFNHGEMVKIICMEQFGVRFYANFDKKFNLLDGKATYKYFNAQSSNIRVEGNIKNGKPEGEFIAYEFNKVVGKGTYKNGVLISGTEILGTNDKNPMFHTKQLAELNQWANGVNNSSNHEFPAIYTQMHNLNIERAKYHQKKIVYQGLHLMKGNNGISLTSIPDIKDKKYIISIYAKGNFKSGESTSIKSGCGSFVIPGKVQIQDDILAQEGFFKGGGASSCTIFLSGFGNVNEAFSFFKNEDFYVSVVIMEEK